MDAKKLKTILHSHEKWLRGEGGKKADLSGAVAITYSEQLEGTKWT